MKKSIFGLFLVFSFVLFLGLNFISADLTLKLYSEFGEFNSKFITTTSYYANSGMDSEDVLFAAPPGNYSKLYSNVSGNQLMVDSGNNTVDRSIILFFETVPAGGTGYVDFTWDFGDFENYDTYLSQCTAASCEFTSAPVNLETDSLVSYLIDSGGISYFKLAIVYNPPTDPVDTPDTGGGGGGGGGGTPAPSIKIDLPKPVSVEEVGPISFNITLKNDGNVAFNEVSLAGSLTQNSKPTLTKVTFSNTSFPNFYVSENKTVEVGTYISSEEVTVYEILINATSKDPRYTSQAKVYLTFIGKNGSGIVKIIAFTEGLINENAECLDLKDMIEDSRAEFDKGNTALAIEKAQAALAACKNILDNPRKPIYSAINQTTILIYLGVAVGLAILLGLIFNLYKLWRFRKVSKTRFLKK